MVKNKRDNKMYLIDNRRNMHTNELHGTVPSWIEEFQITMDDV